MAISEARFLTLIERHLALPRPPVMTDRLTDDLDLDSLAQLELWAESRFRGAVSSIRVRFEGRRGGSTSGRCGAVLAEGVP